MDTYTFTKATPIWVCSPETTDAVFVSSIRLERQTMLHLAIAARDNYRMFINGRFQAAGPARAGAGYARVDEICVPAEGECIIALEVNVLRKPDGYSNESTLEPGFVCVEVTDEEGAVLLSTGAGSSGDFTGAVYEARVTEVELMSHARAQVEYYRLDPGSEDWKKGDISEPTGTVEVDSPITYLCRRAPYATYRRIPLGAVEEILDWEMGHDADVVQGNLVLALSRYFNPGYYASLSTERQFLPQLITGNDQPFTGRMRAEGTGCHILPAGQPFSLLYRLPAAELGYVELPVTATAPCEIYICAQDQREEDGSVRPNTYVSRFDLQPGTYTLLTFEPKLVQLLKVIICTTGEVTVEMPMLLDDSYPDRGQGSFCCSDTELNHIYEGTRRTLRLNTLDLFMDCPQRERGGWLCDSHFSASGAWRMFADTDVERDFLENFLLTDPDTYEDAFFPEVYPSCKPNRQDPGIRNWSFWLGVELAAYVSRTGDLAFAEEHRHRIERFVEGVLSKKGESGLLEIPESQFVDWSLANQQICLSPISIPNNCLAALCLEKLGELYRREEWTREGKTLRIVIESLDANPSLLAGKGDAGLVVNDTLQRGPIATEGGKALELYAGFHREDEAYCRDFVETMGPCPVRRSDPNIGKANLFIGWMLRFDVLAQLERTDVLLRELKDVYLEELRLGGGTFFENSNATSGCHGFNGRVGALLMEEVLGFGGTDSIQKKIIFRPHPGDLTWAGGHQMIGGERIAISWQRDPLHRRMMVRTLLPDGWRLELERPRELDGYEIIINGESAINEV